MLLAKKEKAIRLRLQGLSYSQIRQKIKVSKSTLSVWLERYPLSAQRIRELRDWNPRRIENARKTKLRKRQEKLDAVYRQIEDEINTLSKRELFLAGLFLYWGEGTKAARDIIACTNTDPEMIRFFIKWLSCVGVEKSRLKVKLHLYKDMDVSSEMKYWSRCLGISLANFRKPYIKDSKFSMISYKKTFTHGTCSVVYGSAALHNKVMMGLKYIRSIVQDDKLE